MSKGKLFVISGASGVGKGTVLGLMIDKDHRVQLLIDRPIYESAFISCHPCICTSTLKFKTADLLEKILPHTGHTPMFVDLPEYPT